MTWQHCSQSTFPEDTHISEQGCQVAVATAPLLKSGRRKFAGAVENLGPQGAVKGPPRGQKGSKVAVKKNLKPHVIVT
jgi:hypothetical protein